MSSNRIYNTTYFAVAIDRAGEVSKWKDQKKAHKGKTNSIYRKKWSSYLESQKPSQIAYSEKPRVQRVKKDGTIVTVSDETLEQEQLAHLKSI
jgi:hypothetical protein